jgi:uncharacterized protein
VTRGPIGSGAQLLPLLFLLAAGPAWAAIEFPALTGRVVDGADLLSPSTEERLARQLEDHEKQTSNQVVVVTLPSLQDYPIERFGVELGRHWQIGQAGRDNGALLIVAPKERKVRIEVGYGLEGDLTDILSRSIIENEITPRFKQGDYEGGIAAGVEAMLQAIAGSYKAPKRKTSRSANSDGIIVLAALGGFLFLFLLLFFMNYKYGSAPGQGRRKKHVDDDGQSWTYRYDSHRRHGGGGWGGGGFGGGGGFSGGGGSFGGGGSSGSW